MQKRGLIVVAKIEPNFQQKGNEIRIKRKNQSVLQSYKFGNILHQVDGYTTIYAIRIGFSQILVCLNDNKKKRALHKRTKNK